MALAHNQKEVRLDANVVRSWLYSTGDIDEDEDIKVVGASFQTTADIGQPIEGTIVFLVEKTHGS